MQQEEESGWQHLPGIVLQHIYSLLPLHSRLIVSSTCFHWRDIVWSPYLWRKQSFCVDSLKAMRRLQFFCDSGCILFAKSIELLWPTRYCCSRAHYATVREQTFMQLHRALELLTTVRHLQKFVLKIQRKVMDPQLQDPFLHGSNSALLLEIKQFVQAVLQNNVNLKHVNLGCSPSDYRPYEVFPCMSESSKRAVVEMHIAASSEQTDRENPPPVVDPHVNALQCLQHLSIDWCCITKAFLDAFNARVLSHPLTKLNVFVQNHSCAAAPYHPSSHAWRTFARKNDAVRVSLVFLHEVDGICDDLQHVYPVFMLKFAECTSISEVSYTKLIEWHRESLEAHVMINTCVSMTELHNAHILWMSMRACQIKYITVIGFYINEDIVRLFATNFRTSLQVFHVPKNQILTSAEASFYRVPVSGSKVNELARSMEDILQWPWRPLRRHPLRVNYFSDASDDDFYLNPAPKEMLF